MTEKVNENAVKEMIAYTKDRDQLLTGKFTSLSQQDQPAVIGPPKYSGGISLSGGIGLIIAAIVVFANRH